MIILVLISLFCFLFGIWSIIIAVAGRFPRFLGNTVGTLTKADTMRNAPTRHGTIPILTDYAYTYTVNGKQYRYSGRMFHGKRRLFKKIPLVYITFCPRYVYPYKFSGTMEIVIGILMLFTAALIVFTLLTV